MFQGETAITLDDKGRLAIPTAYRDVVARECGNRLVLTYNPFEDGCLSLYPFAQWETLRDQVVKLSSAKAVNRQLKFKLVGAAAVLEPDGNGRILVPASHRAAVGIDRRAVLMGLGDKFELWSEQAHLAQIRLTIPEDAIDDSLLDLRL